MKCFEAQLRHLEIPTHENRCVDFQAVIFQTADSQLGASPDPKSLARNCRPPGCILSDCRLPVDWLARSEICGSRLDFQTVGSQSHVSGWRHPESVARDCRYQNVDYQSESPKSLYRGSFGARVWFCFHNATTQILQRGDTLALIVSICVKKSDFL